MTITLFQDKSSCCGCGACASVCAKEAITMCPDENGFLYPVIDEAKCIECGRCQTVCAYQRTKQPHSKAEVYAAAAGDVDVTQSASGGMFATMAQAVLRENGAVYGCAMVYENECLSPKHVCVEEAADLVKLKGSKYVQSDLGNSYRDIKKRLVAGQTVLFSGTPCQVAGLHGFLGKTYENLYTVDLICHGVPSAKLFADYLAFEEAKRGGKVTAFRFRDKSDGWKLHASMVLAMPSGENKTVFFEPEESSYYQMFLNSYTYRINCYTCPYACDRRPGDVTIGDYWCIDLVHPELLKEHGGKLDEQRGVSCLIVNNERGEQLISRFGGGIVRFESTYENASKYNRQLTAPSMLKPERDQALALARENYATVDKWYRKRLRPIKFQRAVRAAVPRSLKNAIKKILGK